MKIDAFYALSQVPTSLKILKTKLKSPLKSLVNKSYLAL
jgi:hypothetical protein